MSDPKEQAAQDKTPMQLLPPEFMEYTAMALEEGAKKYGPFNWRAAASTTSSSRNRLAVRLADRLDPKVRRPDERITAESFLEHVVAAKEYRGV